jgi:hypothetical protein
MYNEFKEQLDKKIANYSKAKVVLIELERQNVDLERFLSHSDFDGNVVLQAKTYPDLLELLKNMSLMTQTAFQKSTIWSSSGYIYYSWVPEDEDIPYRIWAGFKHDEVPEELLRGCRVELTESHGQEYRVVCEV